MKVDFVKVRSQIPNFILSEAKRQCVVLRKALVLESYLGVQKLHTQVAPVR